DGGAVHLDRCALVRGPADPLEHGPVVAAPDGRDLLGPVGEDGAGLAGDGAQIVGGGVGGVGEGGAGSEQPLPVALGFHVDRPLDLPRPRLPGCPIHMDRHYRGDPCASATTTRPRRSGATSTTGWPATCPGRSRWPSPSCRAPTCPSGPGPGSGGCSTPAGSCRAGHRSWGGSTRRP